MAWHDVGARTALWDAVSLMDCALAGAPPYLLRYVVWLLGLPVASWRSGNRATYAFR